MTQNCPQCHRDLPAEFFSPSRRKRAGGNKGACRACEKKRRAANKEYHQGFSRAWYAANRQRVLEGRYEKEYGVTFADKLRMWGDQDWACAICGKPLLTAAQAHLDHNHTTGRVRALLCRGCNHLIANACENPDVLASAIHYLERHNAEPV